ncbi:MAG: DUF5916 domain-containing protein, partial [Gemmatimonadaceae bacterium]
RWGMTNNLTVNATIKPDFAEVESDAEQVVIDPRDALYFPEKRPFFLDGLDQFSVPNNLIYTRRIIAPDGALKLTGQVAGTSIGLLSAIDAPDTSTTARDRTLYNIFRAQRDFANQSQIGMAYTDREVGTASNRMADLDGQVLFGQVYNASFQAAESFNHPAGTSAVSAAPLFSGIFARNGKRFGLRYTFSSISNDFVPGAGFISRAGVVNAGLDHRATWFGPRGARLQTLTGDISVNDTWDYARFVRHGDAEDKKLHVSTSAGLRGGWTLGAGVYWETFGYDPALYANYRMLTPSRDTLPFVGTPRIPNRDYVTTLSTPQWSRFSGSLLYIFGQDENFYEWAQANIVYSSLTVSVRPSAQARIDGSLAYQGYWRRTDGSLVGRDVIPQVTLEYQLTRSIFFRILGQYHASETADLRDETRTFYPLLIGNTLAAATRARTYNGQYLFSYQPNPGTAIFLGYGHEAAGNPDPTARFTWEPLQPMSDYFFVKWTYLFRM